MPHARERCLTAVLLVALSAGCGTTVQPSASSATAQGAAQQGLSAGGQGLGGPAAPGSTAAGTGLDSGSGVRAAPTAGASGVMTAPTGSGAAVTVGTARGVSSTSIE